MIRWLPLYVRSRRLPAALAGSAVAVAVMAVAWSAFTDRPEVPAGLAVLTTALAVAPLGPTLAGTDPALEKTAPRGSGRRAGPGTCSGTARWWSGCWPPPACSAPTSGRCPCWPATRPG
ncbi:hypothetical protein V2I01_39055 [Micromonospora sp. BRA006-A]|nr:hypothetical protein [Micromonospora sp. BRA006-A]